MDTAHSQRTKSTRNKITTQDEELSQFRKTEKVRSSPTYCISIESGGACEDPVHTDVGLT